MGNPGGPKLGSGRSVLPPELRRTCAARLLLRPGQWADLEAIAHGWGVPMATAAYAMVATFLGDVRGAPGEMGSEGIQIRAASLMLAKLGDPAAKRGQ